MTVTGWASEDPGTALPMTERLLANRDRGPGDTLAQAMARSRGAEARQARDEAASAPDADETASALVARGLMPGMISGLSSQLGDVLAELEGEREKIAKGERRSAAVAAMLGRGEIGGLEAARRMDEDYGDPARVGQLERRAASLRHQLTDASALVSPAGRRPADGVEAAASRAREVLGEVTRARATRAPERPPFGSGSPGAGAEAKRSTEHTGPGCWVCAEGRRRDAERAAAGDSAWPPGSVITTGYDPGMAYR